MSSKQCLIYGDLAGWLEPFKESLFRYGVDVREDYAIVPPDKVVIQVGDLVHRGPHSEEMIRFVDKTMHFNPPGKWIQLLGNHEGGYIGGPVFGAQGHDFFNMSAETEDILGGWWDDNKARMACAIEWEGEQYLISHAGLCSQTWKWMESPPTPRSAAVTLNSLPVQVAFAPGIMLGGQTRTKSGAIPVGVAWASAAQEVYPSWDKEPHSFNQIHGHSTIYHWSNKFWYLDDRFKKNCDLFPDKRFSCTTIGGSEYFAIDQALGRYAPHFPIQPLIATAKVLEYPRGTV